MSAQTYKENKQMNKNLNGNLTLHEDEYCVYLLIFIYNLHITLLYLIISEVSCIRVMCYDKLCKGIKYLTKYSKAVLSF